MRNEAKANQAARSGADPFKSAEKKTAKAPKKAAPKSGATAKADGEAEVLAKITAMQEPFRTMGKRLHALILRSAPALRPTVWYGMPGYAKDGPVLCFFRADKYMTFGLTDKANHAREGGAPHQLMGSAWFFSELDAATEARLSAIVQRAMS